MADLAQLLLEFEEPLEPIDVLDLDKLLRKCGFAFKRYEGTLLYRHVGWGLTFTFPDHRRDVPAGRLKDILRLVRDHLESEGRA